ncbi:MAG: two-component system OmpR family response regulator [Gammaproteobacteria bacterium]|jgi:two-component system OmpR family response regulator
MRTAASILIVDDDRRLRRLLSRFLSREGYQVFEASDADEMRRALAMREVDLVLLDLMLPGEDGLTLTKELRATSDVPIVMLTGKGSTVDKVVGLEVGADDYVTKPYDERELLARLRTVLRRSAMRSERGIEPSQGHVARFENWRVDLVGHEVSAPNGKKVDMTGNEFQLLASLLTRPNRPLSRQEILDFVFGRNWSPSDRSIDVLIAKLRRKLGDDSRHPHLIKSIRGVGYKFIAKVQFN